MKLDPEGEVIWAQGFGGSLPDFAHDVHLSADYVYLAGDYGSDGVDFGGGLLAAEAPDNSGDDFFVAKFGLDGNHLWSSSFTGGCGGYGGDYADAVGVGPSGEVWVLGDFDSAVLDVGSSLLELQYGWCEHQTEDGGTKDDVCNDVFLLKLGQ